MSDFSELPWFLKEYIHESRWDSFRDVQTAAFEAFRKNDDHIIISSATSSGKTEATLIPVIASLYEKPSKGIGALYIGPLKALIDDQFQRMIPMIEKSEIRITGWHGDIDTSVKKRLLKNPEGILQITPESLQNIIVNHNESLKQMFSDLRFVIIDEIHSFIPSVRGAQILCCLETIERMTGCHPRRIGLSATLGDTSYPAIWLSANTGRETTVIKGDIERDSEIRIEYNRFPADSDEEPLRRKRAISDYYKGLFESVNGCNCLIFTNSRSSAEKTARSLDVVSERYGMKGLVSVHHGSISKEFRKDAEDRMKDRYRKSVTVATSSLELGIDVGVMEKVIQIDPPQSCMSLLQRMGRSGRRGGIQDLTIICNDDDERPWTNIFGVSVNLIRAIAMVELSKRGWTEPLKDDPLPYGLLFHQTLEYMACGVGCRFSDLKKDVLSMYPFRNISEEDYKKMLRFLLTTKVIERMGDGTLLIGKEGERLVFGRDFCSVFDAKPGIDIYIDGRVLGTIQDLPDVGENIQLAGRMWQVVSVSEEKNRADVRPSDEGSCAPWKSDVPPIDDMIMQEMYRILSSRDEYDYLDENAERCLAHSRTSFKESGMDYLFTVTDTGVRICPWKGSNTFDTIRRTIETKEKCSIWAQMPYYIDVRTKEPGSVERTVRALVKHRHGEKLIGKEEDICRGKFDRYLSRELVVKSFVENKLDFNL